MPTMMVHNNIISQKNVRIDDYDNCITYTCNQTNDNNNIRHDIQRFEGHQQKTQKFFFFFIALKCSHQLNTKTQYTHYYTTQ